MTIGRQVHRRVLRALEILREDGVSALTCKGLAKIHIAMECRRSVRRRILLQTVENEELRFRTRTKDEYRMSKIKSEDEILIRDLTSELTDGEVFFDIGSAIGLYAVAVAKICPGVDVVSFEPNPSNFSLLEENVDLNGVSVETRQLALSDSNQTASVTTENVTGSVQIVTDRQASDGASISARRGDDFVSEYGQTPNVIKIDVEGAETLVVNGLRETLRRPDVRVLYCEVHRPHSGTKITDYGSTPSEFEDNLRALGFDIEVLRDPHPEWNYFIKASK